MKVKVKKYKKFLEKIAIIKQAESWCLELVGGDSEEHLRVESLDHLNKLISA